LWLHSLKVAQLLRSAACLHTNQSRSYLNHLIITGSSDKELTLAIGTRHYFHTATMPSILSGVYFATFLFVKECHVVVCCCVSNYNKQANPLNKHFLYASTVSTGDASFNHSHTTTLNMHVIRNGIIVSMYMHLF